MVKKEEGNTRLLMTISLERVTAAADAQAHRTKNRVAPRDFTNRRDPENPNRFHRVHTSTSRPTRTIRTKSAHLSCQKARCRRERRDQADQKVELRKITLMSSKASLFRPNRRPSRRPVIFFFGAVGSFLMPERASHGSRALKNW
jgi:hypothetical protein